VGRAGAARPGRPGLGFPAKRQRESTQLAKRICARCPVRAECLEYKLSSAGTWGGTTPQERDQLRQQQKAVAA
jgi:WhiB family redox-sensing transcriptional regulator